MFLQKEKRQAYRYVSIQLVYESMFNTGMIIDVYVRKLESFGATSEAML